MSCRIRLIVRCQRLSRYVKGDTCELAVICIAIEAGERGRHFLRKREQLVPHRRRSPKRKRLEKQMKRSGA